MARIALVHDVAGVAATQAEILRAAGHDVDHVRMPEFGNRWDWFAKALTLPVRVLLYCRSWSSSATVATTLADCRGLSSIVSR